MTSLMIIMLTIAAYLSVGFLVSTIGHWIGDPRIFGNTGTSFLSSLLIWPVALVVLLIDGAQAVMRRLAKSLDSYAKFLRKEK